MAQLTDSEKEQIQSLVTQFNGFKLQLGDTYLTQQTLLKKIDEVKVQYSMLEQQLAETYGKDAIINVETGEVSIPEVEK